MLRILGKFFIFFICIMCVDQAIKYLFTHGGLSVKSEWIDLVLTYNRGVAFSMFAFLGEYLKIIQLVLIVGIFGYLIGERAMLARFNAELGIILGTGASNVLDRFIHGGVVDYVFWHKWFNFAVFNFADVMINLGVVIILLRLLIKK
ncbi:signal peptidase II [Campylobacter magnus]|uniref:signal peptidase II n=1 Tax=Campylobacter magnus TaxID=3026462 RepID=UPI0026DFC3BB|nr:signal peptidase II [Campylobacter magnus]MDO2408101.1 signal peptidase II [Campylobacter magnus]